MKFMIGVNFDVLYNTLLKKRSFARTIVLFNQKLNKELSIT